MAAKSLQSCPTLCDPTDSSPPGSPVPGILQARTLEWVAIAFSNAWRWKVKVKSLSCVQLLATPWTAAYQAPPSMGFSRQEYWSGLPLPSPLATELILIWWVEEGDISGSISTWSQWVKYPHPVGTNVPMPSQEMESKPTKVEGAPYRPIQTIQTGASAQVPKQSSFALSISRPGSYTSGLPGRTPTQQ